MRHPFAIGDVVVRVAGDAVKMPLGSVCRVTSVHGLDIGGSLGISLAGHGSWPWAAENFRKIDADVTEDFREQLRKLPLKQPVSA